MAPVGAVGEKLTTMVQNAAGANVTLGLQPLLLIENELKLTPLIPVVSLWEVVPPVLVTVNVTVVGVPATTATFPKFAGGGAVILKAAGVAPVPLKLALTVPPGVAETSSVVAFAPALFGVKLTEMVQVVPAAKVRPAQLSPLFTNWTASRPLSNVDIVPEVVPPILVTVKVTGVVPPPTPRVP